MNPSAPSTRLARYRAFAPLALRLPVGFHLIYGTLDNVISWARMLEFRDFLAANGFPAPLACAVLSVAAQFAAGILYLLGYLTRWAAGVMLANFAVALLAIHVGRPYPEAFPALVIWCASLSLLLSGPGAWSIDARLSAARPKAARGTPA